MNSHQIKFLRRMEQKPLAMRDFTNTTLDQSILAPNIVEMYLSELVKDGFAEVFGDKYCITDAGVVELEKPSQIVTARSYCNAQMTGEYRTPNWNLRAGADQHEQFKSRGHGV